MTRTIIDIPVFYYVILQNRYTVHECRVSPDFYWIKYKLHTAYLFFSYKTREQPVYMMNVFLKSSIHNMQTKKKKKIIFIYIYIYIYIVAKN